MRPGVEWQSGGGDSRATSLVVDDMIGAEIERAVVSTGRAVRYQLLKGDVARGKCPQLDCERCAGVDGGNQHRVVQTIEAECLADSTGGKRRPVFEGTVVASLNVVGVPFGDPPGDQTRRWCEAVVI